MDKSSGPGPAGSSAAPSRAAPPPPPPPVIPSSWLLPHEQRWFFVAIFGLIEVSQVCRPAPLRNGVNQQLLPICSHRVWPSLVAHARRPPKSGTSSSPTSPSPTQHGHPLSGSRAHSPPHSGRSSSSSSSTLYPSFASRCSPRHPGSSCRSSSSSRRGTRSAGSSLIQDPFGSGSTCLARQHWERNGTSHGGDRSKRSSGESRRTSRECIISDCSPTGERGLCLPQARSVTVMT
jgi:hypothetical protein